MANFSIKEIIEDMYNEHKIIDSEKYNKLFENIYSRGLITIFSEPDMYEAILIDILINMLKTYNRILILSRAYDKEIIVKKLLTNIIGVGTFKHYYLEEFVDKDLFEKSISELYNYDLFINDSVNELKSIEESIEKFIDKNNDIRNVIFIDFYRSYEIADFKYLKMLSKKYNVLIIVIQIIDRLIENDFKHAKLTRNYIDMVLYKKYQECFNHSNLSLMIYRNYYGNGNSKEIKIFKICEDGANVYDSKRVFKYKFNEDYQLIYEGVEEEKNEV